MNAGILANFLAGVSGSLMLVEESRATAKAITAADSGKLLTFTADLAQPMPSFKSLPLNWCIITQVATSVAVALTPFGSETIDARSSYTSYGGETRLWYRSATELRSIVIKGFEVIYTANNTWIKPPGYPVFELEIFSAGGSGESRTAAGPAAGGCGGGAFYAQIPAAKFGDSETLVVGAGGIGVSGNTIGNNGGYSDVTLTGISSSIRVIGGLGGSSGVAKIGGALRLDLVTGVAISATDTYGFAASAPAGLGGFADCIFGGGAANPNGAAARGGHSLYGGGAGASIDSAPTAKSPGGSYIAGNGGNANAAGSGSAGTAPCGGGGASITGTSGAGARGEIRIRGRV